MQEAKIRKFKTNGLMIFASLVLGLAFGGEAREAELLANDLEVLRSDDMLEQAVENAAEKLANKEVTNGPVVYVDLNQAEYTAVLRLLNETEPGSDAGFYRAAAVNLSVAIHDALIHDLPEYFPSGSDALMLRAAKTARDAQRTVKDTKFPGSTRYVISVADSRRTKKKNQMSSTLRMSSKRKAMKGNAESYKSDPIKKAVIKEIKKELEREGCSLGDLDHIKSLFDDDCSELLFPVDEKPVLHCSELTIDNVLTAIDKAVNQVPKSEKHQLEGMNIHGYVADIRSVVDEADLATVPKEKLLKEPLQEQVYEPAIREFKLIEPGLLKHLHRLDHLSAPFAEEESIRLRGTDVIIQEFLKSNGHRLLDHFRGTAE